VYIEDYIWLIIVHTI